MKLIYEGYDDKLTEMLESTVKDNGVMYIEGPFLMAEAVNRNRRVYPKGLMEAAVDKYQKEYINERRAIGELNHPDRPFADPAVAALITESLEWRGNIVYGKARIINSPQGRQIKALLEANFKLGVSSRGLGATKKGLNESSVLTKYLLNAIDGVDKPSGQVCYVDAVNESMLNEWTLEDGVWVEKKVFNEAAFLDNLDKYLETLKKSKR